MGHLPMPCGSSDRRFLGGALPPSPAPLRGRIRGRMRRLSTLAAAFLAVGAATAPCRTEGPAEDPAPGSRPIEDEAARALLSKALDFSRARLGPPQSRVERVELRLLAGDGARSGHPLTRAADRGKGLYTIYLTARPGEPAFAGQLAHEALHLRDTRLYDVYVEGLCSLLAADLLE